MSKKNYSKMYAAEDDIDHQVTADTDVEVTEAPIEADVEEKPTPKKKKPKTVKGTVVNCAKLNVREQMNTSAAVLCVIPASAEVKVFAEESHPEWEHVITEDGVEGFCMKKYIAVKK